MSFSFKVDPETGVCELSGDPDLVTAAIKHLVALIENEGSGATATYPGSDVSVRLGLPPGIANGFLANGGDVNKFYDSINKFYERRE